MSLANTPGPSRLGLVRKSFQNPLVVIMLVLRFGSYAKIKKLHKVSEWAAQWIESI